MKHPNELDETHMRRALLLAQSTTGLASPNPQVGCVLVRDGHVLGEGAHLFDQFDHAEMVALKQAYAAGHSPAGATAYVTLEPCSHHGRTGPCADALIAARIARCVVATLDPNPAVAGSGVARLRAAGIQVTLGLCQDEARALNNAFACSITLHRPFVTLKAALSADGYLAPPPHLRMASQPFWLTSPEARAQVQQLRHASDAILCGIGTVLADDPLLTDRTGLPRRRPLLRVIADTRLRTPVTAKLVQTARQNQQENDLQNLWIFCGPDVGPDRLAAFADLGIHVTQVGPAPSKLSAQSSKLIARESSRALDLSEILTHLHSARILSLLVEAGSQLNGDFLRHELADQAVLFYAPAELGPAALPFADGSDGPFALERRMLHVSKQTFGPDLCVSGLLHDPWAGLPGSEVK